MKLLKRIGNLYMRVIALSMDYPVKQMNYKNKTWKLWRKYLEKYGLLIKKPWKCTVKLYCFLEPFKDKLKFNLIKWKLWENYSMPLRETWRYLQNVVWWTAPDLYLCGQLWSKTFKIQMPKEKGSFGWCGSELHFHFFRIFIYNAIYY